MTGFATRTLLTAASSAALLAASTLAASAEPPTHQRQSFSGDVTDAGEACGEPLSWEFTGDLLVTTFFDNDGNVVRQDVHVQESGTVTNLTTGEVVELPRTSFLQRFSFEPDGTTIAEVNGLSVRVTGEDGFLLDVGRFVVSFNPNELLQSSGQHPIREINPFSVSDPALLGAFCELFE